MAKYIIWVEAADPAMEELCAEYRMGIECEGFALLCDKGDDASVSIQNMSTVEIAEIMAREPEMLKAAIIAKAFDEADERWERLRREDAFKRIVNKFKEAGA